MKPLGELGCQDDRPQQRTAWWVISTHVASGLVGCFVVALFLGCLWRVATPLDLSVIYELLIGSAVWAVGGIGGAAHGGSYVRRKAVFAGPSRLVTTCALWFGLALAAAVLVIAGFRFRHADSSLLAVLLVIPTTLGFWWETQRQFRKWERDQQQPKTYGFPVMPATEATPAADTLPEATIASPAPPENESRPRTQS